MSTTHATTSCRCRRRCRLPLDMRLADYEAAKSTWDTNHPGVDYRSRDLAMRQFTRHLGV